jgi:addiction module HigA family antidote
MAKSAVKIPGVVLKESFLDAYGLSQAKLAKDIGMSLSAIRQILIGRGKISLNIAVRLSKYFGKPLDYWLDLQTQFDLAELQKDSAFTEALKKIPKAKKQAPVKKTVKAATTKKPGTRKAPAKKAGAKAAVKKVRKPGRPKTKK